MVLSLGVVISSIAQASDYLHHLVNNFNFNAFVVPDRIREHAKSQPIKADICEELSLNLSEVSSLQGEVRTFQVKQKKQAIRQQRPFKLATTSPRRDFMSELRERLAERSAKANGTAVDITERKGGEKESEPIELRRKLMFHVGHETGTVVETIPVEFSRDRLRRSTPVTNSKPARCNVFMGCLEEKPGIKSTSGQSTLKHGEFQTMEDANKALSDCEGRHGDAAMPAIPSLVKSVGEEVINPAVSGQFESSRTSPIDVIVEEESEEKEGDEESDAESMVALKHGKREKVEAPMEPQEAARTQDRLATERQEEAWGLVMIGSDVAVKDDAITGSPNKTSAEKKPQLIVRHYPSETTRQFDEAHQKELRSRIKEFQERKLGGAATPISLVGSSLAGSRQRPLVNLPKASRKIAQGYVDALTKKLVEESGGNPDLNVIEVAEPQDPPHEALKKGPGTTMAKNSIVDSKILGTTNGSKVTVARPRLEPLGTASVRQDESGQADIINLTSDVMLVTPKSQEVAVDIDCIVSQIDKALHQLVVSGTLDSKSELRPRSDEERRTLSQISAELLHNLAVLRAQQSFGGGSKTPIKSSRGQSFGAAAEPTEVSEPYDDKPITAGHGPLVRSGTSSEVSRAESTTQSGRSIQELRAKRDRAVIAIRDTARRLSGWSENTTKESSQSARIGTRNLSKDSESESEHPLPPAMISPEPFAKAKDVFALSHEQNVEVQETLTVPSLGHERLYRFPVPSQLRFNAGRIIGGRDSISADPSGDYTTESDFDVSTLGTENLFHLNAEASTLGSVRDELPEVAQLESMIRGLLANSSRARFTG